MKIPMRFFKVILFAFFLFSASGNADVSRQDLLKNLESLSVELESLLPAVAKLDGYLKENTDINIPLPEEHIKTIEKKNELYKKIEAAFQKVKAVKIELKLKLTKNDWQPADLSQLVDYFLFFSAHSDSSQICDSMYSHLKQLKNSKIDAYSKAVLKSKNTKAIVNSCLRLYEEEYKEPTEE